MEDKKESENEQKEQVNVKLSPKTLKLLDRFKVDNRIKYPTRSNLIEKAILDFLVTQGVDTNA